MASAYGIIHQYGEPKSTFDTNLALQSLEYKQNKYDANVIKMEQVMSQYGMQMEQLVRDEDKEHLYNNLNKLVNNIEGLRGADFASNQVTQGIIGHINQALDPQTIKQLGNSQKVRQFQNEVQTVAKEDPEKFSQLNYQDAMITSGYQSYMNGETDDLGNLTYTPYIDNQKDIISKIKDVKDILPDQTVQVKDGKGNIIEKNTDNLTVTEWMSYMPSLISEQNRAQFAVEGRAALNWNNESAQELKSSGKLKQQATNFQRQRIGQINLDLQANPSTELRRELIEEKQQLNGQIAQIENQVNSLNPDATSIGSYMMMNDMVGRLSSVVGSQPSVEVLKDQAYYDNLKEQQALNPNGIGSNLSVTARGAGGFENITTEDFEELQNTASSQYVQVVNTQYNELPQEKKTLVDQQIDRWTNPESKDFRADISEEDARYAAMQKFYGTDDLEKKDQLENIRRQRDNYLKATENTFKEVNEKILWDGENLNKIYDAAMEKGVFDATTIKGQPSKEYLESRGVKSVESFKRFLQTEEGKDFKATVYADYLYGESNIKPETSTSDQLTDYNKQFIHNFKRLANTIGESKLNYTDVFNISFKGELLDEEQVRNLPEGSQISVNLKNGDSKVSRILNERIQFASNNAYNNSAFPEQGLAQTFLGDNTADYNFYQDRDIRNIFDYDNYKKEFNETLNTESIRIAGANQVMLNTAPTSSKRTLTDEELEKVVSNVGGQGFNLEYGQPVSITTQQQGNERVFVISQRTQGEYTDRETGERRTATGNNTATVSETRMADLAPNLFGQLRQSYTEGELVFDAEENFEIQNISFPESTPKNKQNLTNYLGAGLASTATTDDSRKFLRASVPSLYQEQSATYGKILDESLKQTNKFKVNFNKEGQRAFVDVMVNTGTLSKPEYERLQQLDMTGIDLQQLRKALNTAPQTFITQALAQSGLDFQTYQTEAESFDILNRMLQR